MPTICYWDWRSICIIGNREISLSIEEPLTPFRNFSSNVKNKFHQLKSFRSFRMIPRSGTYTPQCHRLLNPKKCPSNVEQYSQSDLLNTSRSLAQTRKALIRSGKIFLTLVWKTLGVSPEQSWILEFPKKIKNPTNFENTTIPLNSTFSKHGRIASISMAHHLPAFEVSFITPRHG